MTLSFGVFSSMILNERAYLTLKSIFHKMVLSFFCYLRERERVSISFLIFIDKQGNHLYRCLNVFGITRSFIRNWARDLPHSKPALYHYTYVCQCLV